MKIWRTLLCLLLLMPCSSWALVVLQYHHIDEHTPAATSTTPEEFSQHLEYLAEHKFEIWSLPQLRTALQDKTPLPDKAALITFDDGYRSVFDVALPMLRARQWPFVVFVNSDAHDRPGQGYMSWAQLRELSAAGAIIANHTSSHAHLTRRLGAETTRQWQQRVLQDINRAEQRIEAELQQSHKFLAYPYGEFNAPLQKLLRRQGYMAFGQHSGPIASVDSLQALPRFPLGGVYANINELGTKLNSLPMPLLQVAAFDEGGAGLVDGTLAPQQRRPQLQLTLPAESKLSINCFASRQGAIAVRRQNLADKLLYRVQANEDLAVGRSRYNCTAVSQNPGQFYWYSYPWLRAPAEGEQWPD